MAILLMTTVSLEYLSDLFLLLNNQPVNGLLGFLQPSFAGGPGLSFQFFHFLGQLFGPLHWVG